MPAHAYRRYAIYYTPPPGPLARFGAEWLGWDVEKGSFPDSRRVIPGLGTSIDSLTEKPRRYGFHATVKSPFRLAKDHSERTLITALSTFCSKHTAVGTCGLEVARLGGFAALVPAGDARDLNDLAAQVVEDLDLYRSEETEAEIARRDTIFLSDAQRDNLRRWGYPYVLDSYRFHMTLTGAHGHAQAERTRAVLADYMAPLLPRPFTLESLSLVGENTDGRFKLIQRFNLGR
ncbi:MAG: DUF1045 domain-containing protein [Rhodobacterales bacterium]|nr:DUF1045 domain-containing protein [Rhodobacterales bacterium]